VCRYRLWKTVKNNRLKTTLKTKDVGTVDNIRGRKTVKVKAELIRDDIASALLLSCNGKRLWIPRMVCNYEDGEVKIVDWYFWKLTKEKKI